MGQPDFAAAGSGLAFALSNFDCANFLPLVFIREEAALGIAFRFAAMRPFYVSLRLRITQAAIARWNACPQRVGKLPCGFAARYSRLRRWLRHCFGKVDPPA